jgi:hypothetical protein
MVDSKTLIAIVQRMPPKEKKKKDLPDGITSTRLAEVDARYKFYSLAEKILDKPQEGSKI